jgi:hypothetical protein
MNYPPSKKKGVTVKTGENRQTRNSARPPESAASEMESPDR